MTDSQTSTFKMDEAAPMSERLTFVRLTLQAIRDAQFRDNEKRLIPLECFCVMTGYYIPLQHELTRNLTRDGRHVCLKRWRPRHFTLNENYLRTVENYPEGTLPRYMADCPVTAEQYQVTINIWGIETDSVNDPDLLYMIKGAQSN